MQRLHSQVLKLSLRQAYKFGRYEISPASCLLSSTTSLTFRGAAPEIAAHKRFTTSSAAPNLPNLPNLPPLSNNDLFQLLDLKEFTKAEISEKFEMLATKGEDGEAVITAESVEQYTRRFEFSHSDTPQIAAGRLMASFASPPSDPAASPSVPEPIPLHTFEIALTEKASTVSTKALMPITISMLLVGSSVGIVTPVMPYVVENLGLTTQEFGGVIAAFGVAKLLGNIPSAILVEKHGRKPYLVYSLALVAIGNGGIGWACGLDHLLMLRLR